MIYQTWSDKWVGLRVSPDAVWLPAQKACPLRSKFVVPRPYTHVFPASLSVNPVFNSFNVEYSQQPFVANMLIGLDYRKLYSHLVVFCRNYRHYALPALQSYHQIYRSYSRWRKDIYAVDEITAANAFVTKLLWRKNVWRVSAERVNESTGSTKGSTQVPISHHFERPSERTRSNLMKTARSPFRHGIRTELFMEWARNFGKSRDFQARM